MVFLCKEKTKCYFILSEVEYLIYFPKQSKASDKMCFVQSNLFQDWNLNSGRDDREWERLHNGVKFCLSLNGFCERSLPFNFIPSPLVVGCSSLLGHGSRAANKALGLTPVSPARLSDCSCAWVTFRLIFTWASQITLRNRAKKLKFRL